MGYHCEWAVKNLRKSVISLCCWSSQPPGEHSIYIDATCICFFMNLSFCLVHTSFKGPVSLRLVRAVGARNYVISSLFLWVLGPMISDLETSALTINLWSSPKIFQIALRTQLCQHYCHNLKTEYWFINCSHGMPLASYFPVQIWCKKYFAHPEGG